MDRALDDIIAERPRSMNRGGRRNPPRRNDWPRDGVRKSTRDDRADPDHWVHDRFDDNPDTRRNNHGIQNRRQAHHSPEPEEGAKIRVDNLHYDLTEDDLEDLFNRIGPVTSLTLRYDRAGRSDGTAYVTYSRLSDARSAIREFDGANAKGQPIRLSLMPTGPAASRNTAATAHISRNPFDTARMPAKSLFERISAPAGRSESPESDDTLSDEIGSRRRGPRRGGGFEPRIRPSDVSKPPPDNIDRYVPDQRSRSRSPPRRRRGDGISGGRRPGERRERDDSGRPDVRSGRDRDGARDGGRDADGRRLVNGRPRKTQEELDREMEDYWGGANDTTAANGAGETPGFGVQDRSVPEVLVDEDVDMIE